MDIDPEVIAELRKELSRLDRRGTYDSVAIAIELAGKFDIQDVDKLALRVAQEGEAIGLIVAPPRWIDTHDGN